MELKGVHLLGLYFTLQHMLSVLINQDANPEWDQVNKIGYKDMIRLF